MSSTIRRYELYIGYVESLDVNKSNKLAGSSPPISGGFDLRTLPENGKFIKLTNHQMTAKISFPKEGTNAKNPEQVIEVFNPAPETVEYIRTGNVVFLAAGYEDDDVLPIICATQILRSNLNRSEETHCLKLNCVDALKVKRNAVISKTYPANLTYGDVVEDLTDMLEAYGVPSRSQTFELYDIQLKSPLSFSDSLFDALDDVLKPINYKWHMAAGTLYIQPRNNNLISDDFVDVLQLYSENVVGSVELLKDTSTKEEGETDNGGDGIKVVVNLNGDLSSGDAVRINFEPHEGQYRITSVLHTMDYEGKAWFTTLECVKI